ncbi:hypothetical protein Cni_G16579 [Canna indica]|uniref:CCHC-type domain-containing protein n=1 Tax=Canna indica TaxID=4628 RepID=A0AAQ3QGX4_9LILI|nr:hypothetical protein Cni_G16579 [Canna indica]
MASGFFCFKFTNYDDMNHVLSNGPWFLNGQVLLVIPWKANFQPLIEKIDTIPVWIQLPGLSIEYMNNEILFKLASAIGTPIKVDDVTSRGSRARFARICVLWELNKSVPNGIWINSMNGRIWQAIVLENIPKFCYGCGRIGHLIESCVDLKSSNEVLLAKTCETNSVVPNVSVKSPFVDEGVHGPWQVISRKKKGALRKNDIGIRTSDSMDVSQKEKIMKSMAMDSPSKPTANLNVKPGSSSVIEELFPTFVASDIALSNSGGGVNLRTNPFSNVTTECMQATGNDNAIVNLNSGCGTMPLINPFNKGNNVSTVEFQNSLGGISSAKNSSINVPREKYG